MKKQFNYLRGIFRSVVFIALLTMLVCTSLEFRTFYECTQPQLMAIDYSKVSKEDAVAFEGDALESLSQTGMREFYRQSKMNEIKEAIRVENCSKKLLSKIKQNLVLPLMLMVAFLAFCFGIRWTIKGFLKA